MKRESKKELKSLEKQVNEPRDRLFDLARELHDSGEITTKQYIDATTAIYALTDVFKILKES